MSTEGIIAIAASLAVLGTGIGAAIGIGRATGKAVESVARQPEAAGNILKILVLGASLVEATAVYALVIALILLLVR
ncbi:MAG TPA: ATP synthase F0 subunit C [Clostridiaceae bacterium]|nr:ATP synthase F0 subunit C [Clostridiaceae bacterium]